MSVLQVLHIPDERLRKVAKPVEEVNAEIRKRQRSTVLTLIYW